MGLKSFIKRHEALHKPAVWIKRQFRYSWRQVRVFTVALRRGTLFSGLTSNVFSKDWENQKFIEYSVSLPHFENGDNLAAYLRNSDLRFHEGAWTIYIPPQDGLDRHFSFLTTNYPPNVGLKILKSFGRPEFVKYVTREFIDHPNNPFWNGDIPQLIRVANYLYSHGIGPRLYDVISMKSQTQIFAAFVIQHIDSETMKDGDYSKFIGHLRKVMAKEDIIPVIQRWETHVDFSKPNCNGNLVRDANTGNLYYVDFQSFMFKNEKRHLQKVISEHKKTLHFGTQDVVLGGKFLYQSIPGLNHGRRDTERRWRIISDLLEKAEVNLKNAIVFDVCCNAGMMLYHAIVEGAFWGVGWDLPEVAEVASTLQSALGITRIDIYGKEISKDTRFILDLPPQIASGDSFILFYLAASKHIGFPEGVGELPWTTMVYEGHEKEDIKRTEQLLGEVPWLKSARIESITTNKAELGEIRTIALLKRKRGA